MYLLVGNRDGVLTGEGGNATEHFVHNDPERINVASLIGRYTLRLFGREIGGCAHYSAGLREPLLNSCTKRARNTKVSNFYLTGCTHKDVSWFDITVDHAVLMRRNQS